METDKWLTLPDDLLVDIFRRLMTTAIIRCACACRPWRRTIINNASCLRSRPDRFHPDVLLGFLELDKDSRSPRRLQYVPASNTSPFTPAAGGVGVGVCVDGRLYNNLWSSHNLWSSRDGFLLLGENMGHNSLCLCSALTGACKVLPAASLFGIHFVGCMYVLATANDFDDDSASNIGDETALWILAVKWLRDSKEGMVYQIYSSTSGAWGPVKCSPKFPEYVAHVYTKHSSSDGSGVVVCHGAVSWFVQLFPAPDVPNRRTRTCIFSVDLRTERTWITEMPIPSTDRGVLAVSEDGQLSLVKVLPYSYQKMEVWVLVGDDQWTHRRTINVVHKLFPNCPSMWHMSVSGFCPRSGYLFGTGIRADDWDLLHRFLIGIDGSSPRLIGTVNSNNVPTTRFPYEMDWSAHISKMKYF